MRRPPNLQRMMRMIVISPQVCSLFYPPPILIWISGFCRCATKWTCSLIDGCTVSRNHRIIACVCVRVHACLRDTLYKVSEVNQEQGERKGETWSDRPGKSIEWADSVSDWVTLSCKPKKKKKVHISSKIRGVHECKNPHLKFLFIFCPSRCSGLFLPPLITLPCTRTGFCQASRVTSFWETELTDVRGWSWNRATPSSFPQVSWHYCCLDLYSIIIFIIIIVVMTHTSRRTTLFRHVLENVSGPWVFWAWLVSCVSCDVGLSSCFRLDSCSLHPWGLAGVWRQHSAQLQHSHAAQYLWDREQD